MITQPYEGKNGELFIEGVSTVSIAEELDTPLYIYSKNKIRNQYEKISKTFDRHLDGFQILYSAKANNNLSILKILKEEGAGLDAVSPGEVYLAKKIGFEPRNIFFTGTSVRDDEMIWLINEGININIDSISQMKRLLNIKTPRQVSVRVNPNLGAGHHDHVITGGETSKFGVWKDTALDAYELAYGSGVESFGIQMHIGSGVMVSKPFLHAAENLLNIAGMIRDKIDISFDFVDLGGGIGIPYKPGEEEFDINSYSEKICSLFLRKVEELKLGEPELWLELGRYLVAEAGILLTRVNTIKETPYRKFAGVDAGFNTLLRPTMYGSYHHIYVANKMGTPPNDEYDIAGPICESGDLLAKSRLLPHLREGDLLAVMNTGAYGFSMGSEYNSRPRAAEVLVSNGQYNVIRKRGSYEDLLLNQKKFH